MELAAPNLFHDDSPWTQSATTAPAEGGMEAGVEWEHQGIWKSSQGENSRELCSWETTKHLSSKGERSWCPEPAAGAKSLSSGETGLSTEGQSKGIICAVLGDCFSCATGENRDFFASKRISELEYTAAKSKSEFKSSLVFDRETGEKLGIQVDKLGLKMIVLKLKLSSLKPCSLLWSTKRKWWRNCLWFQILCGSAGQCITQTLSLGTEVFGTITMMIKP